MLQHEPGPCQQHKMCSGVLVFHVVFMTVACQNDRPEKNGWNTDF